MHIRPLNKGAQPLLARRTAIVGIVAATSLAAVAACGGPGSSSSSGGANNAAPTAVNTDVASQTATLTLFTGAGTKSFNQALVDGFHSKYPAITINLQVEADNNYNTVLPRLLASDTPPDLAAPADLLSAVKDGLITNLDTYDKAYGWSGKIPSNILAAGRVENGVIGSGSLYLGGGAAGPLVGVFYNKSLASKVGLTAPPATLDEMASDMDKAKAMGITPIIASNSDGLIGHLYSLLLNQYMGPQNLLDVIYHKPGATLDTDAAKQATTLLSTWMKAGYFNSDANATNQDQSYGKFAGGQGLFLISGTWVTQALPASFKGQYGIFPLPAATSGGKLVSMTGNQLALAISSKSQHKDAAALFLNWLTTPEAATIAQSNGYPSAIGGTATAVSFSQDLTDQIQAGYSTIAADNGFSSWLQNSVSTMTPVETAQLQSLLGGQTTPDAMIAKLQSTYTSGLKAS